MFSFEKKSYNVVPHLFLYEGVWEERERERREREGRERERERDYERLL